MPPIKRKFLSALWRFKQATLHVYRAAIQCFVEVVTEKYWLLDYLPTLLKRKEGVLLVRLDLIGDFVLWLDSAQAYRRLYPKRKITLFVNSACKELAEGLSHWDTVIDVDVQRLRNDYLYRLRTLTRLRSYNFAVAIQPAFSRELVGDLVTRATYADDRIGYAGDTNNISKQVKEKTDTWYTRLVTSDPSKTMELNINAHFVRQLGCADFLSDVPVIPPVIPAPALGDTQPYIVIAPGASWQPKMWPIERFTELSQKLLSEFNLHIVLCGGKDDRAVCEKLFNQIGKGCITNLAGQTTLIQLTELIRHAQLVVSNDSSPVHIAAAVGTASVCILGGGHFGRFLPYSTERIAATTIPSISYVVMECFNCNWRCKYQLGVTESVPCISNINIPDVFQKCSTYLRNNIHN